jgi:glucans biosynthesis protein C
MEAQLSARNATVAVDRLPCLDAIRASALLLGIALHASLSFVPGLGVELWPIRDVQQSVALTVASYLIHIFRMSVFFFVAGLLARSLLESRGLSAFCKNRLARILLPLVVAWPICFALLGAVVLWALARANGGQLPSPLPTSTLDAGLNFLHLWFLYLLLWLYAIGVALRMSCSAIDRGGAVVRALDATLRASVSSHLGPLVLALPVVMALYLTPNWVTGMGVPTPGYTLVPPIHPLFIYLYVFMLGWGFDRQRDLLGELAKRWPINFGFGLIAALAYLQLEASQASGNSAQTASNPLAHAAAYGIALLCWTFAFVGVGVRYFNGRNTTVRYLADASYWMYIIHLPVVMGLQTALMFAPMHWAIKYPIIVALGATILLLSYQFWVRSTWVGRWLNGKKHLPVAVRLETL